MLQCCLELTRFNRKKLEILVQLLKLIGKWVVFFYSKKITHVLIIVTCKHFRYELIIKPSIPKGNDSKPTGSVVIYGGDNMSLTPKLLKARKEAFYRALLERTKDCHEVNVNDSFTLFTQDMILILIYIAGIFKILRPAVRIQ